MKPTSLAELKSYISFEFAANLPIAGFSVDSRTIRPNEIYVALPGQKVDGHSFLEEVEKKGCHTALVAKTYHGPTFGLNLVFVENTLEALQNLAREALKKHKPRIVAVTGSVGKTTTKEFIATLLKTKFKVCASPGNSNSQVGLPLSILNEAAGDEEILILEMGMTMPGHIQHLISIAPPEVSVITSVALVHACSFNTIEDIARTKAEIFSHSDTKLGIMPYDIPDKSLLEGIGTCKKTTFSIIHSEADYFLQSVDQNTLYYKQKAQIDLGTIAIMGKHNLHNILAAMTVALYFGISLEEIADAVHTLQLPEKRLQVIEKKGIVFVNDSYNAAEISVKAALDSLPRPKNNGRKIAVLGSMMELGKFSDDCHRKVGEHALNLVDQVYCYGQECRPIFDVWHSQKRPVEIFLDQAELINSLKNELRADDVVLLKGSRSKQLWKVLEEI